MNVPVIGFSQILLRLSRYRMLLLVCPIILGILVGGYFKLQRVYYTSYARLLPPQTNTASATSLLNQVGGNAAVLGASALTLKNPSDLYASLFLSRTVQDMVIKQFKLAERYEIEDMDKLRVDVAKRTKVSVGKDGVITLSFTDFSAQETADIANGLIEAMYQVARRLARDDTRRRLEFYDGLLDEARQKYQSASDRLLELELQTGLTRLKGQEESSSSAMAELRGLIATREIEMQRAQVVATGYHPEVVRMRAELASLRHQLAKLETSVGVNSGLGGQPQVLANAKKDKNLFVPFQQYAHRRTMVEPARNELESYEKLISDLIKAREFSRGDETRDLSVMQVLDYAVPPTEKSGPRTVVNGIVGMILGFLLTILAVLFYDILFTDPDRRKRWSHVGRAFIPKRFLRKPS
jgi:tyrosine-protein kinase Etk/Wzc